MSTADILAWRGVSSGFASDPARKHRPDKKRGSAPPLLKGSAGNTQRPLTPQVVTPHKPRSPK